MTQNERDDYDDEPFGRNWVRNPKLLRWAGTLWLIAWGLTFLGNLCIFGPGLVLGMGINEVGWFIVNLVIVGLFLLGAYLARKGKPPALVVVSVCSSLGALFYGAWGVFIGLNMMYPYGPPNQKNPEWTKVLGAFVCVFAIGFLVCCLFAYVATIFYAIKKKPVEQTTTTIPTDSTNV